MSLFNGNGIGFTAVCELFHAVHLSDLFMVYMALSNPFYVTQINVHWEPPLLQILLPVILFHLTAMEKWPHLQYRYRWQILSFPSLQRYHSYDNALYASISQGYWRSVTSFVTSAQQCGLWVRAFVNQNSHGNALPLWLTFLLRSCTGFQSFLTHSAVLLNQMRIR